MDRRELVSRVSEKSGVPKYVIEKVLSNLPDVFAEGLSKDGAMLKLKNIGVFRATMSKHRVVTIQFGEHKGEQVSVPPKKKIIFNPAPCLLKNIND